MVGAALPVLLFGPSFRRMVRGFQFLSSFHLNLIAFLLDSHFDIQMADRDSVAIDIEEMLAMAQPLFTPKCCIYNVPHEIRQLNEDAYTPQVVSIGPLHRGYKKLLKMEGHKQVYCQYLRQAWKLW